jgi:hypothetical protein
MLRAAGMTYSAAGKVIGTSPGRVYYNEAKGLRKLRSPEKIALMQKFVRKPQSSETFFLLQRFQLFRSGLYLSQTQS